MNRLKEIINQKEINVTKMASDLGLSRSYMYKLMEDISTPTITIANKIAAYLEVDVNDIWNVS